MEEVGEERGDEFRPLDIPADTLAELNAVTLGDKKGDTHALVDTLADTVAEVEAVGDTSGDSHALVDTLAETLPEAEANTRRHKGRCARTSRNSGGNASSLGGSMQLTRRCARFAQHCG